MLGLTTAVLWSSHSSSQWPTLASPMKLRGLRPVPWKETLLHLDGASPVLWPKRLVEVIRSDFFFILSVVTLRGFLLFIASLSSMFLGSFVFCQGSCGSTSLT